MQQLWNCSRIKKNNLVTFGDYKGESLWQLAYKKDKKLVYQRIMLA